MSLKLLKPALFYFLLLCADQSFASESCRKVFNEFLVIDQGHGTLNQNHKKFEKQGLYSAQGKSYLCGPVCLFNVVEKFLVTTGQKTGPGKDPTKLVEMIQDLEQKNLWFDPEAGVEPYYLQNALTHLLSAEKLRTTVTHKTSFYDGRSDFTIEDLKAAVGKDTTVIVSIQRHIKSDWRSTKDSTVASAHYLVLTGYDAFQPSRVFFSDPSNPTRPRAAILEHVKSGLKDGYIVHFEDRLDSRQLILLKDAIFVTAVPE